MKKQYKYLLMTLLSLIFLGACSSGEDDIPEPAPKPDPDKVTISTTNLTTEANGGTSKLTFTTNKAWTASSNQAWCKLDKTSGTSGAITINLTLEANTTDQERTAEITIKAGTSTATATVKQAKKEPAEDPDKITLGESSFSVEAEGKALTITLTTNKAWTATSDQTWCTLSQTSGEAGTINLTATVSANTTDQERTTKISFKAGTATATATVKQAKKEPAEDPDKITLGESSFSVEAEGKALTITLTANKAWTATSDQTWCTLSQTSGEAGTISLTATVSANTTDQERTAKISFKAGTATATATVKQAKKEAEGGDQGGEEGGGESGSDNGNTIEDMKNKKW